MATIKTQGGKVLTKDGKVSCECCVECPSPEENVFNDLLNKQIFEITKEEYNKIYNGATWDISIEYDASFEFGKEAAIDSYLIREENGSVDISFLAFNGCGFADQGSVGIFNRKTTRIFLNGDRPSEVFNSTGGIFYYFSCYVFQKNKKYYAYYFLLSGLGSNFLFRSDATGKQFENLSEVLFGYATIKSKQMPIYYMNDLPQFTTNLEGSFAATITFS
jgi:hypothetical protein